MEFRGLGIYQTTQPLGVTRHWSAYAAVLSDHCSMDASRKLELRALHELPQTASAMEQSVRSKQHLQLLQQVRLLQYCQHTGIRRISDFQIDQTPPFAVVEAGDTIRDGFRDTFSVEQQTAVRDTEGDQFLLPGGSQQLSNVATLFEGLAELHRLGLTAGTISTDVIFVRLDKTWCLDVMAAWCVHESAALPQVDESAQADAIQFDAGSFDPRQADPASDVSQLAAVSLSLLSKTAPSDSSVAAVCQILSGHARAADVSDLQQGVADFASQNPMTAARIAAQIRGAFGEVSSTIESSKREAIDNVTERTFVSEIVVAQTGRVVPETMGRFQIHERLGEGAVGAVYRATDMVDGTEVAIKILNDRLSQNPVTLRRFTKEARMLSRAESPYVARLIDSNHDNGFHFLALEYVAGGTLSTAIRSEAHCSEKSALRIALDVALGLAVAHREAVFHRDIKPDNILLTTAGAAFLLSSAGAQEADPDVTVSEPLAKLSDFGLARSADQSESLAITQDGAILGTPLYMSPEQCRGLAADARSDVYSLGATLFHLLAGRPPFPGDSHVAVMHAHCNEPLPSLRQLRTELSDACISVVEKCLARNPDSRYPDAESLVVDLQRLLQGEPTSILVHPAAPTTQGRDVVETQFVCHLSSSPEQLWPFISNTDRVNHAIGLSSVTYTTRTHPERGVERFAEARIAGQKLAWQEHPYEWIEGRRLSVLREFTSGPFVWFMNIVELHPASGGGTRLVQTLRAVPKNIVGRLAAKLEMGHRAPRNFPPVYAQIDQYLQQGANAQTDPFMRRTAITAAGRRRLLQRAEAVMKSGVDPGVIETLRQFLENASDLEAARIRPLVFAERFHLEPKEVIRTFLLGAREGMLIHLWDILCPTCRIPADVQETLRTLKDHAYCPACDLKYEVDFASSVELIFRVHPDVRHAETQTYCIGGPAFSAHVVAQIRLAAGECFDMEANLVEGTYRLRGPQLPFAVDIRISSGQGASRLPLSLLRPPLPGTVPALRQGTQVLSLNNNTSRDLLLRLERTAGKQHALTAAAVSTMPLFRELFPGDVLSPGQIVSVNSVTLLMVELSIAERLYKTLGDGPAFGVIRQQFVQIDECIRQHSGTVVRIVGEGMLCVFQSVSNAVKAGVEILSQSPEPSLGPRIAIDHGPAMVTTLNDRLDYFGAIVSGTQRSLELTDENEISLPARLAVDDEIAGILAEHSGQSRLHQITEENSLLTLAMYHIRPRTEAQAAP